MSGGVPRVVVVLLAVVFLGIVANIVLVLTTGGPCRP